MSFLSHSSSSALSLPANWALDVASDLPPGPRGRLVPNFELLRKPIEALREWQTEFGHTFTVDRLGIPTVITAEPELVGQIYGARDLELFDAVLPASANVLVGPRSLLMLSGRRHQIERKLLMPAFHGERMRGWAATIAEAGHKAFGAGEYDVVERAKSAALEVIIRVVFGVAGEGRVHEFATAINQWARAVRPGFLFFPALQHDFFGLSPFAAYRRAFERVEALLDDQIARTRAGRGAGTGTDVLTGLVEARYEDGGRMDDASIRDHLRTLLFAGHETIALTLAWVLHFVHRDVEVRRRLLDELAGPARDGSPELFARLPYLAAVIDETLRLRPISVDGYRRLCKPWRLGPWRLPAGTAVCPAPTLIHARADLWPEPEKFRPERFLESRPRPDIYLPFGGGSHRCLGATFARFEAAVLLGTLMRELEFQPIDREVRWGRGRITLEPLGGVHMRARERDR